MCSKWAILCYAYHRLGRLTAAAASSHKGLIRLLPCFFPGTPGDGQKENASFVTALSLHVACLTQEPLVFLLPAGSLPKCLSYKTALDSQVYQEPLDLIEKSVQKKIIFISA